MNKLNNIFNYNFDNNKITKSCQFIVSIFFLFFLFKQIIPVAIIIIYNICLIIYYTIYTLLIIALVYQILMIGVYIEDLIKLFFKIAITLANKFIYKITNQNQNNNIYHKHNNNKINQVILKLNNSEKLQLQKYIIKELEHQNQFHQSLNQKQSPQHQIQLHQLLIQQHSLEEQCPLQNQLPIKFQQQQQQQEQEYDDEEDLLFDTDQDYVNSNNINNVICDQDINYKSRISRNNYKLYYDTDEKYSNIHGTEKDLYCEYDYSFHFIKYTRPVMNHQI